MGLNEGDLEKVPENFSIKECYERIYKWHMSLGLERISERDGIRRLDEEYILAYRNLIRALAQFPPDIASQEDTDFIFREVIMGLMEWSYHKEDEFGIKMGAYAHFAINKKYGNLQNQKFQKSYRESKLLKKFLDLDGWKFSKYWEKYTKL
jgi:hypothetical protein